MGLFGVAKYSSLWLLPNSTLLIDCESSNLVKPESHRLVIYIRILGSPVLSFGLLL